MDGGFLHITFSSKRVEKCFEDYSEMQRYIPLQWVRTIKKHVNHLRAAERFGDFLKLGIGHPEALKGKDAGRYSVHVNGNVRLIIQPDTRGENVLICEVVEIKGVIDYHGGKESWYIR